MALFAIVYVTFICSFCKLKFDNLFFVLRVECSAMNLTLKKPILIIHDFRIGTLPTLTTRVHRFPHALFV